MSDFTDRVLWAVSQIPPGKVASYGQIALMVDVPRAARQVGWALHWNGGKVPWWRVVNKRGFISNTCNEHDRRLQKSLLEKEGIKVSEDYVVDMEIYRFRSELPVA